MPGHEMGLHPWARGTWHGHIYSIDGTETEGVLEPEVEETMTVLAYGETTDNWDGYVAGLVRLED